jgi:hypothetical protein
VIFLCEDERKTQKKQKPAAGQYTVSGFFYGGNE